MDFSVEELAQMRTTVTALLDELHLDAYLFEIEPKPGLWEINVECATVDGWSRFQLTAATDYLLHGRDDAVAHAVLLDNWRDSLAACKLKSTV
ncbi:MAG: hypothetical protein GC149_12195 [Gammaproteobacteria bacterium]|nr:hypothetical protein [Gammaproteobacteria bacterium]